MTAEELARRLWFIEGTLAPEYELNASTVAFEDLPDDIRKLKIATAHFVLEELAGGPKCPHLQTALVRYHETRVCLQCGMVDPLNGGML